ncbi:MAG: hypothetical protein UX70_C0001G0618 [Candidatus Wolfebacteria bacterium GW2011_GWB1_47_1]|uniref:Uncharacterized protein n=1 Tax=Candidatus Wolfebacteria bacterium GW2011_GWB1_47_1 TaxID=1619007 RepID=A0A0G4ARJ4_9BACT|nr:MAG: hypothetical protein UX70_C0001G0618 [Candidatus Wolfebacteria bacterium GW2011_GWB1_47_1]
MSSRACRGICSDANTDSSTTPPTGEFARNDTRFKLEFSAWIKQVQKRRLEGRLRSQSPHPALGSDYGVELGNARLKREPRIRLVIQ